MNNNNSNKSVYGRVSSVFFDSEKSDVFVNVVTGPNREPREMPFSSPRPGVWYVPQEGDMVEVHDINGSKTARFPANPPADYGLPETLTEGDVCFRLNTDTKLHFSVQDDGSITVDLSADNDINITTTGNVVVDSDTVNVTAATEAVVNSDTVNVTAATEAVVDSDTVNVTAATEAVVDSPTVKLGGDTGTEVVARKGDSVEVSDPLSGTLNGEITSGASNTEAK